MERELYNRGLDKALQGDFKGAIQDFDQALQINPQFAEAYYKRGVARFDLGDHPGAIADYTQALQLNPESIENYCGRSLARLAMGNPQGAIEDANQVLQLKSNHAPACNLQGTIYRRLGDTQQAIASFKKAAQLYLEQKDAVNCRRCLDSISQIQDAQKRAATQAETEAFFNQAVKKVIRGNYRAALEDFNWLLQIDPGNASAYCYRGVVLSKLGNHQGAIQDLGQAMQLNPQDAQLRSHRGLVRIEMGDYRGAIDDFSQFLHSNPNNPEAYMNRGQAYHKLGNYRQANEDFSRALSVKPNDADLYCQRAVVRADFDDHQGAIDDYQKAANIYFDKQDWASYQQILNKIKTLQASKANSSAQRQATQTNFNDRFFNPELEIKLSSQPSSELQNRLLRLVGGYWDVAERLINLAKQKNPGMPEDWYWEKVIEDIERDR
jgi:tetratricopeptide (TPR) repeat protein